MYTQIKRNRVPGSQRRRACWTAASLVINSLVMIGSGGAQASEESEMVERTVVTLNGDEDPIVTKTKITVAQQRADAEARRRLIEQGKVDNESSTVAGAIVDERPCLGFGYWISLYDETSFHGDEICFNGHGWAYLPNYLRLTGFTCEAFPFICEPIFGTWDRAVRSVITGITVGHLCPIGDFCWEFNGAQFIPSTSDPRILNASWVHLE